MRNLLLLGCVLALLGGCDQISTSEPPVDVVVEAPSGPKYALVDGDQYGYESVGGTVLMVRYMGFEKGEYQFLILEEGKYSGATIIKLAQPYDFVKEVDLYGNAGNDVADIRISRIEPASLVMLMVDDARNKRLAQYQKDGNHYWLNAENKIELTPVDEGGHS